MLGVLLKKQLSEVFRSYFYDAKKNKMRSKWAIIAWFLFFILMMVGMLGGIFTGMAVSLCDVFVQMNLGWMYFLMMNHSAILLGAFGSVFNTYSCLYLSKDNDLLLSLPIPVKTIIASRLLNVYLLGTMYTMTAVLPALIVYWITAGFTWIRFFCGILLALIISLIVLILSTLLGYLVAKISLKLKNKSFVTVIASLLFIAAYYFFYFKINGIISHIVANADTYAEKIKGYAYLVYCFGRIGEGDLLSALLYVALLIAVFVLIWIALSHSFLSIATSGGIQEKTRYVEKKVREKTIFMALLEKEFARFTASANYMLNCGLGTVVIPICGIMMLLKGKTVLMVLDAVFVNAPGISVILVCVMLCWMTSMNVSAVPSVSLEGKSLWIPQSLPVEAKTVLHAKMMVQLILTLIPMLFTVICASFVLNATLLLKLLLCLTVLIYSVFSALFAITMAVKMPILNWTSEIMPIKQSGAMMIVMFGSWAITVAMAGLYLWIGYQIGAVAYLSICSILFGSVSLILWHWLNTKGAAAFAAL